LSSYHGDSLRGVSGLWVIKVTFFQVQEGLGPSKRKGPGGILAITGLSIFLFSFIYIFIYFGFSEFLFGF